MGIQETTNFIAAENEKITEENAKLQESLLKLKKESREQNTKHTDKIKMLELELEMLEKSTEENKSPANLSQSNELEKLKKENMELSKTLKSKTDDHFKKVSFLISEKTLLTTKLTNSENRIESLKKQRE